ncbi:hypothetical protein HQ571_06015 [Candidatus Kuenenbacteria bacterium]|nr:hypothetical protein [Candidatus Kuenenbacteria bacterium]
MALIKCGKFDFRSKPEFSWASNWRELRAGNLRGVMKARWDEEEWVTCGALLESYIKDPPEEKIYLGFQTFHGMRVIGFLVDWAKCKIIKPGEILVLYTKSGAGTALVWAPHSVYSRGIKIPIAEAKGINELIIAAASVG